MWQSDLGNGTFTRNESSELKWGLEAQFRDVQFDGNNAPIESQDEVSFTWAEAADRHATMTSADEPSTHYLGLRIDGSR